MSFVVYQKQLNSNLKGINFSIFSVHQEVALMSYCYSETCLLLYVHEQFAKSVQLLCSTVLHMCLLLCGNNGAAESSGHSICNLSTFRYFAHTPCVLIYISFVFTTNSLIGTEKVSLL